MSEGRAPRRRPRRGDTRGEGTESARGRCGGKAAPSGELGVHGPRAGTSSVTRLACREGSNEADQQQRGWRGRNVRAMRAALRNGRSCIARSERGLQVDIIFMVSRRARRGIRWPGGGGVCVEALISFTPTKPQTLQRKLTDLPALIDQAPRPSRLCLGCDLEYHQSFSRSSSAPTSPRRPAKRDHEPQDQDATRARDRLR